MGISRKPVAHDWSDAVSRPSLAQCASAGARAAITRGGTRSRLVIPRTEDTTVSVQLGTAGCRYRCRVIIVSSQRTVNRVKERAAAKRKQRI